MTDRYLIICFLIFSYRQTLLFIAWYSVTDMSNLIFITWRVEYDMSFLVFSNRHAQYITFFMVFSCYLTWNTTKHKTYNSWYTYGLNTDISPVKGVWTYYEHILHVIVYLFPKFGCIWLYKFISYCIVPCYRKLLSNGMLFFSHFLNTCTLLDSMISNGMSLYTHVPLTLILPEAHSVW